MKKIVIVAGEPNSINSEIIFKSWRKISKNLKKRIYIISNYNLLSDQLKKLKCKIKLVKVSSIYDKPKKLSQSIGCFYKLQKSFHDFQKRN